MRKLLPLICIIFILACGDNDIVNSEKTKDLIEKDSNSDSTLVFDANCGKMNYKVYYDSLKKSQNPFGKATIRVVAENKNGVINEFFDSSDSNYSFIEIDLPSFTIDNCEDENPTFYAFYKLLNDDHASLNSVIYIKDSLCKIEAKWTTDGMYFTLNKEVFTDMMKIKEYNPNTFKIIQAKIMKEDSLLNSDWINY